MKNFKKITKAKFFIFSKLLLVVLFTSTNSSACYYGRKNKATNLHNLNSYIVAFVSTKSHCKPEETDQKPSNECLKAKQSNKALVYHGLWSQDKKCLQKYISHCSNEEFNFKKIDPNTLAEWKENEIKPSFIKSKWKKYGTCSGLTQYKYVKMNVKAIRKFSRSANEGLTLLLSKKSSDGIFDGVFYKDIQEAILPSNPKSVYIRCMKDSANTVEGIYILTDKFLKPTQTSEKETIQHECGEDIALII
ncbi:MAG: hypothetical protein JJW01_02500 [Alphaproteobacteria bacterium]|nr:hypothetical protein [Rickettsiales bacterium]